MNAQDEAIRLAEEYAKNLMSLQDPNFSLVYSAYFDGYRSRDAEVTRLREALKRIDSSVE